MNSNCHRLFSLCPLFHFCGKWGVRHSRRSPFPNFPLWVHVPGESTCTGRGYVKMCYSYPHCQIEKQTNKQVKQNKTKKQKQNKNKTQNKQTKRKLQSPPIKINTKTKYKNISGLFSIQLSARPRESGDVLRNICLVSERSLVVSRIH